MSLTPLRGQDCSTFSCGDGVLDTFLQTMASQHQRKNVSRTHLRIDEGTVVGFVTVTVKMVKKDEVGALLKKHPPFPLPSLLLARLGVNEAVQHKGVGRSLFKHVLRTARQLRDLVGCVGVWVDSKPKAVSWYEMLGFKSLGQSPDGNTAMFLPITMIPDEPSEPDSDTPPVPVP